MATPTSNRKPKRENKKNLPKDKTQFSAELSQFASKCASLEGPVTWAIDPGLVNFHLSIFPKLGSNDPCNVHINFKTWPTLEKQLPILLDSIWPRCHDLLISLEQQVCFKRHNNPNVRIDYFLRGVLHTLKHKYGNKCHIVAVAPRLKKYIAQAELNWSYSKLKSKKAFNKALNQCASLHQLLSWSCVKVDYAQTRIDFTDVYGLKKFDDIVDTLILAKCLTSVDGKIRPGALKEHMRKMKATRPVLCDADAMSLMKEEE